MKLGLTSNLNYVPFSENLADKSAFLKELLQPNSEKNMICCEDSFVKAELNEGRWIVTMETA